MPDVELAALLVLVALPELGPRRLRAVLGHMTASEALAALAGGRSSDFPKALAKDRGLDTATRFRWARALRAIDPAAVLARHRDAGVVVAGPAEIAVTPPWEEDPEPPTVLFRLGRPIDTTRPAVALIGTRRCTAYGRAVARRLGADLAEAGITVVSGVAAGIDGAAQAAALQAGGQVVGVVASGLDRPYPRVNVALWQSIAAAGSLISEYPLGADPLPWRFPARNRLIAALAEVLVVVESQRTGGSMHTVEAALERGRTVMAVPGPVTSATSSGTNQLLVEGAMVARDAADVVSALGLLAPASDRSGVRQEPAVDPDERALLDALGWEPCTVDALVERTGREATRVAAALTRLSLRGIVGSTSGWWERQR